LLAPKVVGSRCRWSFDETVFEVDAACGARVTCFSLGGDDILSGTEVNALNFGSTFWTSPQSQWGWPPPGEIDSEPYEARLAAEGNTVRFEGRVYPKLGIAVAKTFAVDATRGRIDITYTIANRSAESLTVAPWEISRHPTRGLTYFPTEAPDAPGAPGDRTPDPAVVEPRSSLRVVQEAGAIWFAYDAAAITDHQKMFARGHRNESWIAHVDIGRRLHLVKTFPPLRPGEVAAPGEAALEIYADPDHTYVEVEQQGPYRPLGPGQTLDWTVTWQLRRLPSSIAIRAANPELLVASRALVSGRPTRT
jgi:hypothetical protein